MDRKVFQNDGDKTAKQKYDTFIFSTIYKKNLNIVFV